MTYGAPDPVDLSAVRQTDDLIDDLANRRFSWHEPASDTTARLLAALAADVDYGAPPLSRTALPVRAGRTEPRRRRGARAFIGLGVATAVLTTTGVAAANGFVGRINRALESGEASKSQPAPQHSPRPTPRPDSSAVDSGTRPVGKGLPGVVPNVPVPVLGDTDPANPVGVAPQPLRPDNLLTKGKLKKVVKTQLTEVLQDVGGPLLPKRPG